MADNKINRFVMKRELKATSKQRKFYRILSGGAQVARGISRGELADMIAEYPEDRIAAARVAFKAQKRASKYMRAMMDELELPDSATATRQFATASLNAAKKKDPEAYAKVKARLRGFTYADE